MERRQAKLLSNSQSLENDVTVEESSTGENQEESNGLISADGPHDVPSASTQEEGQLEAEETQLDHPNLD